MVTVFYSALARSFQLTHQGIPVPDRERPRRLVLLLSSCFSGDAGVG